ncbi:MAG TPA: tetratricopeptide repeat-containing glycosyltransferase family protein, partial [Burkholderiales bacterium]|nr:tetratricopeptide repeat-containing glycosyltransferase family protein [Burkholderiales bacterium]
LGNLLDEAGQLDAAIRHLERAVALSPDLAEAHNNLGVCLDRSGLGPRAREHFQRAIALNPTFAEAIFNDAKTLAGQGRLEDAKRKYEAGLRLQPGNAKARLGYGIAHLLGGELEQGWEHYEARPSNPGDAPYTDDTSRRWRGEPLEGRTLLLHAEQGFGDTIQFVRFVPQLAASGARIVLELQPPLVALLAGVPGVSGVITRGTPRPAFDWQCPLPSLPYVLALGLDRIAATAEVPYLHAEPARLERWRARLGGCRGLRIGLAWAGNPNHLNDLNRSLPFAVLRPLADIAGVSFVALQKGPALAQAEAGHGPRVLLPGDELGDFADTAAAIAQLDLVISVDTSVAHLAGALGKPAWVLLPFAPDWRWMLEREDSPWYPTMRLFRQSRPRDWAGVIERVGRELTALAAQSDA